VEISILNSNIGLRALHYFWSWSNDENSTLYVKSAGEFYDLLDAALVNQNLPKHYQSEAPKQLEMDEYLDK
jgi:hypothetical protein